MNNIFDTIKEFTSAIKNKEFVDLNESGYWITTKKPSKQHLKLLTNFNACFKQNEAIPIKFNAIQTADFVQWLKAAEALENYVAPANSKHIQKAITEIKRHVIGMKYRLEAVNGGCDLEDPDPDLFKILTKAASAWKQEQPLFWDNRLNPSDFIKLEETCRYPEFVKLILTHHDLANDFFLWIIRDGIDPLPFIAYPVCQQKIVSASLNGRIGRLGGRHLRVMKSADNGEKYLALEFDGVFRSVLDHKQFITFKEGYTLTLDQVYHIFSQKCYTVGNLEFFSEGITNWNSHQQGRWNPSTSSYQRIPLDIPFWWTQLPILEVLTREQAIERYGKELDGEQWVVSANASREYLSLHFDKTHAYLEIAIPLSTSQYAVYIFGKFATKFPTGTVEALMMVTVSVLATIAYPDENVFYTHRQHIGYPFVISPKIGHKLMESIKEDIIEARNENCVFQMESENCGKWIQTKLEKCLGSHHVPNLYRTHLINSEPDGILGVCWRLIRRLPKIWRTKVLAWCHFPLGAWKGRWIVEKDGTRVWKSLYASSFWDDGIVHLPSYLHTQADKFKSKTKD